MRINKLVSILYYFLGALLNLLGFPMDYRFFDLILLVLFIGIFLHLGLYSFNEYFDLTEDINDKRKAGNSITIHSLNPKYVLVLSVILIIISNLLVLIFYSKMIVFALILTIINILYTTVLKRINYLLSSFIIATTGPLKVLTGYCFILGSIAFPLFLVVHYLMSVIFHLQRQVKKGHILQDITKLQAVILTLAIIIAFFAEHWFVWIIIPSALLLTFIEKKQIHLF